MLHPQQCSKEKYEKNIRFHKKNRHFISHRTLNKYLDIDITHLNIVLQVFFHLEIFQAYPNYSEEEKIKSDISSKISKLNQHLFVNVNIRKR